MFLFAEDGAIKEKVSGLTLYDDFNVATPQNARDVPVWFRMPEVEQRKITYPMITVDFLGLTKADDREQRGHVRINYVPDELAEIPGSDNAHVTITESPIPFDMDYQITTHCRSARDDRFLLARLMQHDRLPARFGYLDVPEDDTRRNLQLLSVIPFALLDDNGKRLFRRIYSVRVPAELTPTAIQLAWKAKSFYITIVPLVPGEFPIETLPTQYSSA